MLLARDQDRAHHGDGRDGVGQRHQRRVQQPRHAPDHVQADEGGQHEHKQRGDVVHGLRLEPVGGRADRRGRRGRDGPLEDAQARAAPRPAGQHGGPEAEAGSRLALLR